MTVPSLHTDLSVLWGLIHVSAKFTLPLQQNLMQASSSAETLIPSEVGAEKAIKTFSPGKKSNDPSLHGQGPSISMTEAEGERTASTSTAISPQGEEGVPNTDRAEGDKSIDKAVDRQDTKDKETIPASSASPTSLKDGEGEISPDSKEKAGKEPLLAKQPSHEVAAFNSFRRLCSTQGLLKRPLGIGKHDVPDGINDDATLL